MVYQVTTAPTIEPLTVDDVKAHCRIDGNAEDTLLTGLIKAARQHIESATNRALISQTITAKCDEWADWHKDETQLWLPMPPLISVTSVQYVDSAGATQTLAANQYTIDTYSLPGRVIPAYGVTWPTPRYQENAITVVYLAGYGTTAASVPQPIRQAMLFLVAHWYENREPVNIGNITTDLPFTVAALVAPYRVMEAV